MKTCNIQVEKGKIGRTMIDFPATTGLVHASGLKPCAPKHDINSQWTGEIVPDSEEERQYVVSVHTTDFILTSYLIT